jgi:xanthine dehydrogenase YagT iron-sulfur-binding subunit
MRDERDDRPEDERDPADDRAAADDAGGVSRRDFLKGLGVGGGAVGAGRLAARAAGAAPPGPRRLGPGPVTISLQVNGRPRTLSIEPRVTLLDALRDRLDLTGAKEVCDRGSCGACTVLVDGRPVYACMMLALDARGRAITTIEGIGTPEKPHPIQRAFVEKDALQCGYCTPGFVVAARALLESRPNPTLDEVREGLAGHVCRCGTYTRICEAVLAAAGRKGGAS